MLGNDLPGPPEPKVVEVAPGDTLGAIAKAELGSARRWVEIVALNGIDDPDHVPAGTVIKLPSR